MTDHPPRQQFDGSCHCGNVRFTFVWPEAVTTLPTRECGCTFCRKHGGNYTSHPDATIDVTIKDPEQIECYRFGTETAEFYICRTCGVVPLITCGLDGTELAVVNVNTFNDVDRAMFETVDADYDGESIDERLSRRKDRWIGTVRWVT